MRPWWRDSGDVGALVAAVLAMVLAMVGRPLAALVAIAALVFLELRAIRKALTRDP